MRRAADLGLSYVFAVTGKAAANDLTRFQDGKRRDLRLVSHPLDVEFTRSVTAFTAGFSGGEFSSATDLKCGLR